MKKQNIQIGSLAEMTPKPEEINSPVAPSQPQATTSGKKEGGKSRSIGHYIIGKNIGEGTFGKVKLGTHILTGEKVGNSILIS